MATETKSYRITAKRPIGGIMRKPGDVVALTEREYQAESGWGGIEPAEADAAPSKVEQPVTVEPEVEQPIASADNPDQPEAAETDAPAKKRAK